VRTAVGIRPGCPPSRVSLLLLLLLLALFPALKLTSPASRRRRNREKRRKSCLILPTIQKSRVVTVRFGVEVEEEKDRCLEYFADFARPLCEFLRSQGHWADYIDPSSGLPVMTPHCTRPYSEVAGFEHLLIYKTQNAGCCCKILLHPRWGSSCYPATTFTTAPLKKVQAAIKVVEKGEGGRDDGAGGDVDGLK